MTAGQSNQVVEVCVNDTKRVLRVIKPLFILDVRTSSEFNAGHLPGAVNIPLDELNDQIDTFSSFKDSSVLVYCQSGKRSTLAISDLKQAGYNTIFHFEDGYESWKKEFVQ